MVGPTNCYSSGIDSRVLSLHGAPQRTIVIIFGYMWRHFRIDLSL